MTDFLEILAKDAMDSINEGYYENSNGLSIKGISLKEAILKCKVAPIISEIKFVSPSQSILKKNYNIRKIARDMEDGGVVGISILTEPKHFGGNLQYISDVRRQVKIPILMKDIILSPLQIDAAYKRGANAVLLIQSLFDRGYCEKDILTMIKYSHSKGLDVLLEVHNEDEFLSALKTDTDIIGINNRNLKTLEVNLDVSKSILIKKHDEGKVIVSESGINNPEDIRSLKEYGARAFLVGTSIMNAKNIKKKVVELVKAL